MENSAIISLALTFIAGASTAIGAALTFFMRKNDFRVLALGMSFSAGVMIYISFMDIMPMSVDFISGGEGFLKGKAGIALAYAMFFVGVIAAAVIDYFVPAHVESEKIGAAPQCPQKTKAKHAALMTAIAISIHNFPEGLSVFVTTLENVKMGAAIALAIILHNIPEGISVALPIYNSTGNKKRAFWIASLSGLAEPAGALAAYLVFAPFITQPFIGAILALTAGIMVFISLDELLPMAKEYGQEHYGIIGAFAGMAFIAAGSLIL